jgi:hypothetical protein
LSFNYAVIFDFVYFHFHHRKAKSLGNVLMNRQNEALGSMVFLLVYKEHGLLTHLVVLCSVVDPDPGSGIRDWVLFDPWIPDLGSRIPDPKTIFLRAF